MYLKMKYTSKIKKLCLTLNQCPLLGISNEVNDILFIILTILVSALGQKFYSFGAVEYKLCILTLYVKYMVEVPLFPPFNSTSTWPQDVFLGSTGPISHTTLDKSTTKKPSEETIFQIVIIFMIRSSDFLQIFLFLFPKIKQQELPEAS